MNALKSLWRKNKYRGRKKSPTLGLWSGESFHNAKGTIRFEGHHSQRRIMKGAIFPYTITDSRMWQIEVWGNSAARSCRMIVVMMMILMTMMMGRCRRSNLHFHMRWEREPQPVVMMIVPIIISVAIIHGLLHDLEKRFELWTW